MSGLAGGGGGGGAPSFFGRKAFTDPKFVKELEKAGALPELTKRNRRRKAQIELERGSLLSGRTGGVQAGASILGGG